MDNTTMETTLKIGDLVIVSMWLIPNLTESERTGIITKMRRFRKYHTKDSEFLYKVQFFHNKLSVTSTWTTSDQIQKIISRAEEQKEQK